MNVNSIDELYIAVDLGTTTVEVALVNQSGELLDTIYFKNPQSLYGRDVITRIYTATRDKSFICKMKDLFTVSLIDNINKLISINRLNPENITNLCICGNTTMISILLNYQLDELGAYPFNHTLDKSVLIDSNALFGIDFPLKCPTLLSGCASAFIGGDVLSGLYYVENQFNISNKDTYLFLDLGTNGELILYNQGKYYSASCACGPAFEASSRCENIYGTTLIDAITLGIKAGKINEAGILADAFIESGLDIMGVYLSADILREILLAKAAIRTGIELLIKESCTDITNINKVFIAGAFGFNLNIDNAIFIGLIPADLKDRIEIVGNTSLKGGIKLSISNFEHNPIDYYIEKDIELIQMANYPDYQEYLINNMKYK